MNVKLFVNMRTRLQRLRDARLMSGWVRDINDRELIIQVVEAAPISPGEQFSLQIHGKGASALFIAVAKSIVDREVSFIIRSQIKYQRQTESARMLVDNMTATISGSIGEIEALVVDLSEHGAGVMMAFPLAKGETVLLKIDSPQGQIVLRADVRYCRRDPKMPGQYRAGMSIAPENRVDSARWNRLFNSEAA